ncbi:hypothetical protein EMIT0158MI4_120016 [Burkholderia ambifaria]
MCSTGRPGRRFPVRNGARRAATGEGFFAKRNRASPAPPCGSYNMLNVRGPGKERQSGGVPVSGIL